MWNIITLTFPYAVVFTSILLIVSLGGLYSERSGVVNIGLEGLMVIGFFASAITIYYTQDSLGMGAVYLGLIVAIIAASAFSLFHAFASITLNANQVISGTAINMIAGALTIFLARSITGSGNISIKSGLLRFDVPLLSKIPIIGPLFFTQTYMSTWIILAILGLSWFLLYRTSFGLRLRACGEHPHAAASAGVPVRRMRYIAVSISGALAGLGGGVFLVTQAGEFNGTVSGLGFLALASLIFGQWRPLGIFGATLFFGIASTIANVSQVIPELQAIPPIVLKTFPYIVTLIALMIFSKKAQAPKAIGLPYIPGQE